MLKHLFIVLAFFNGFAVESKDPKAKVHTVKPSDRHTLTPAEELRSLFPKMNHDDYEIRYAASKRGLALVHELRERALPILKEGEKVSDEVAMRVRRLRDSLAKGRYEEEYILFYCGPDGGASDPLPADSMGRFDAYLLQVKGEPDLFDLILMPITVHDGDTASIALGNKNRQFVELVPKTRLNQNQEIRCGQVTRSQLADFSKLIVGAWEAGTDFKSRKDVLSTSCEFPLETIEQTKKP